MAKVGIFAGTFDPVHNGHVAFALAAMAACQLDYVVFMPEPKPRLKQHVTTLKHRVTMLEYAVAEQPRLRVLVPPQDHISVADTLPFLREHFAGDKLTLLVGSDVAATLPTWPGADVLVKTVALAVGVRSNDIELTLPVPYIAIVTPQSGMSASRIRSGQSQDVASAVYEYIRHHHLYGL